MTASCGPSTAGLVSTPSRSQRGGVTLWARSPRETKTLGLGRGPRVGICRYAMPRAPRQPPPLTPPIWTHATARTNSDLDKIEGKVTDSPPLGIAKSLRGLWRCGPFLN